MNFKDLKKTAMFLQFTLTENEDFIQLDGTGNTEGFHMDIDKNTGEHFYMDEMNIDKTNAGKYQLLLYEVFCCIHRQEEKENDNE